MKRICHEFKYLIYLISLCNFLMIFNAVAGECKSVNPNAVTAINDPIRLAYSSLGAKTLSPTTCTGLDAVNQGDAKALSVSGSDLGVKSFEGIER